MVLALDFVFDFNQIRHQEDFNQKAREITLL